MAPAFADLVAASDAVAATRARGEKIRILADLLRRLAPHDVAPAVRFLVGRARREALGVGPAAVYRAEAAASPAANASLSIAEVTDALAALRGSTGSGSNTERGGRLVALLSRAPLAEQSFITRWLVGELRQGALEGVVVEAVAAAATIDSTVVREALMAEGDLGVVAESALRDGESAIRGRGIRLFHAVLPMLAATARTPGEALERFGEISVEAKLDGFRIQVHKAGDRIEVYSRSRRRMTDSVPAIVASARRIDADSLILDGEAIALGADGRPESFQDTMSRFGGAADAEAPSREVPLVPRYFDCLLLAGEPTIALPQRERARRLAMIVPEELRVSAIATSDAAELDRFVRRTLDEGHEGVVLKSPEAAYRAGRRGTEWLKWKPAVTLDLVVLAAEWGHGRRRGRLSNIHLGARDPNGGGFVMIGKTFKGMTDAMLAWQTERFLALAERRDEWTVYVEPSVVVEIAFDGVQRSTQYAGGVALRFARVKRYREDKSAADADTIDVVRSLLPS